MKGKNYEIYGNEGTYSNYLKKSEMPTKNLTFLNLVDNITCPSKFVYNYFDKFNIKNLIQVNHNDITFSKKF